MSIIHVDRTKEINSLRALIRTLRTEIERTECECDGSLMNAEMCGLCILMGIIDEGLDAMVYMKGESNECQKT